MSFLGQRSLNVYPLGRRTLHGATEPRPAEIDSARQDLGLVARTHQWGAEPLAALPLNGAALGRWARTVEEIALGLPLRQRQRIEPDIGDHRQFAKGLMFRVVYNGTLFLTLSHQGQTWRVSTETVDGGIHLWRGKIGRLSPIRFAAQGDGGYVKLSWGQIGLFPDCFTDQEGRPMAPPRRLHLTAHWGLDDLGLGDASLAFEGEALLRGRSEEELVYETLEPAWDQPALEQGCRSGEAWGIASASVGAFGRLRLATTEPHGLETDDEVFLQPTGPQADFGYTGLYRVAHVDLSASAWFEVEATYDPALGTEGLASAQIAHRPLAVGRVEHLEVLQTGFAEDQVYYRPNLGADQRTFEDSVEITADLSGAPGEALMAWSGGLGGPGGRVTASGTAHRPTDPSAPFSTLADLFGWAAERLGLELVNPDGAQVPLDFVQTEPIQLLDLLDQTAGYAGYLFYIRAGQLTLLERTQAHGTIANLGPNQIERLEYRNDLPLKELRARWSRLVPATEAGAPVVRERSETLVLSGPDPQGESRGLRTFNQSRAAVRQRFAAWAEWLDRPVARLSGPLARLSNIGERFILTDSALEPPLELQGQVEALELDFVEDLLTLSGRVEVLS